MIGAIANVVTGGAAADASISRLVSSPPQAPEKRAKVFPVLEYFSPVVHLDVETQRTVLMYRDAQTGKVVSQYPSEKQLEAYRQQLKQEAAEARRKLILELLGTGSVEGASEQGKGPDGANATGPVRRPAEGAEAPSDARPAPVLAGMEPGAVPGDRRVAMVA